MRTFVGVIAVLGVIACGRPDSVAAPEVQAAPIVASEVAAAVVPSVASGLDIGIIYVGNMMGELEPCG